MKTLEIKGSPRAETGKKESRKLRRQGKVPCVIYGGEKNIHFSADRIELEKLIYTPEVYLLKLDLEGEAYNAVMKDIQFHPVSEEILHIDFIQVFDDQKLTMNLPIELTGSSVGIRSGGKLRQRRRQIKVQGLIKDMPDRFAVDMSDLDIGDFLKVGDLSSENLEILDPPRAMVVGVVSSRLIAKGLREEVVEEEEAIEGEVVEEGEEQVESGEAPETPADKEDTSQEG
jgi:large subunit ribosomal protein L25